MRFFRGTVFDLRVVEYFSLSNFSQPVRILSLEQAPYLTLSKPINHVINSDQNLPDENRQNNSSQSGKASIYRANLALQGVQEMADEESNNTSQVYLLFFNVFILSLILT